MIYSIPSTQKNHIEEATSKIIVSHPKEINTHTFTHTHRHTQFLNESHPTVKWAKLGSTGLSILEDLKYKLVDKFLRVKRQRDYDQQLKSSKLIIM